jgi:hypothetical protein
MMVAVFQKKYQRSIPGIGRLTIGDSAGSICFEFNGF